MNEQVGKKRDWIKNAVIVFLIIMLLLTFFSNTIMNYSLPEVSAQYVNSGTIQAKVRGNGTVSAGDPYTVVSSDSRTIESVGVRNGDHVEKDQVLFYLKEGESTELKEAEKLLDDMIDAYKTEALKSGRDIDEINKIINGQLTSYNTYKAQIDALKKEIADIEAHIAPYIVEVDKVKVMREEAANATSSASPEKRKAYEACVFARQDAEAVLQNAINTAGVKDVEEAKANLPAAESATAAAEKTVNDIKNGLEYQQAETMRNGLETKLQAAKAELEKVVSDGTANDAVVVDPGTGATKTKKELAEEAWNQADADLAAHVQSSIYQNLASAEAALVAEQSKRDPLAAVVAAESSLTAALKAEEAAWKEYEAVGPDNSGAINQYDAVIKINEDYIKEHQNKVTEKEAQITDILSRMTEDNNYSSQLKAIQEQRQKVSELKTDNKEGNIVAPVSGTVQNITLKAGTDTVKGETVATILPDGTEYTMEVSVTREQAQRLSVGDIADIQNSWYYSNVTCVLQQIKTDKSDPTARRILVFKVEGDVADGQSLNISIGQKSADYDNIVPNSAIREDNNGKFVLIVSSKSSPLGNRYYAERVDVQVLASDDTRTAITGDLNWDYVITTSTKPVEAGQLIRLAD